jgi:hypothetical protein
MANELSIVEPIPMPDPQRPAKPISFPHWAKVRLDTLKIAEQPDQTGIYRKIPVLPGHLQIIPTQREAIERYRTAVAELLSQTPERGRRWAKLALIATSKLLMASAGREAGDFAGKAKGEAYMAAVDDVPYWATEEAVRLWYRGECGAQHNYTWPPAPAVFRAIARQPECKLRSTATRLEQLLIAEPELVFSDDHRAEMLVRLSSIIPSAARLRP